MLNDVPAVCEVPDGTVMVKDAAAAGVTVIALEVAVNDAVAVSVAVTVCNPTVLRTALKEPVPLVSVELGGRPAGAGSLEEKCTVPAYEVAVLPAGSRAVTVKPCVVPAT